MKSSLKRPTHDELRRFYIIKFEIGCIVCEIFGNIYSPAYAHHILSGGNRISHMATIPLCGYHHDDPAGISIHGARVEFIEDYGTEMELLEATNRRVKEFEGSVVG